MLTRTVSLLLLAFSSAAGAQAAKPPIIELRIARANAKPGYAARRLADSLFYVSDSVLLSDPDIERADTTWPEGRLAIPLRLKPVGQARLADATRNHVGDRLAVFFDGDFTVAVPIVSAMDAPRLFLDALDTVRRPVVDRIAAEIVARWPIR